GQVPARADAGREPAHRAPDAGRQDRGAAPGARQRARAGGREDPPAEAAPVAPREGEDAAGQARAVDAQGDARAGPRRRLMAEDPGEPGGPDGDEQGDLYDALAPVYDEWQGAEDQTPFADVVLDKLEPELRRFGGAPPGSFVDFGCGTGALLHGLRRRHPAWRLCGVDRSAAMLAVARGKP